MISQIQTASQPIRASAPDAADPAREPRSGAPDDRAAFDHFVRHHAPLLRRFLTRRVPGDAVDDVLQEVLLTAWASWTGTLAANLPILYRIARFKAIDWFRVHVRQSTREAVLLDVHADTQDDFARSDERMLIATLVAQLPHAQQEVIKMYYEDGLTLAEIAAKQGRGLSVTKYHFYRAHEEITRLWQEEVK